MIGIYPEVVEYFVVGLLLPSGLGKTQSLISEITEFINNQVVGWRSDQGPGLKLQGWSKGDYFFRKKMKKLVIMKRKSKKENTWLLMLYFFLL